MDCGIAIWGTGWEGEKFLFGLDRDKDIAGKIRIEYAIDTYQKGEWHGLAIYTLKTAPKVKEKFIVVAAVETTYLSIRKILLEEGFKEFDNFVWAPFYRKKICVINANCYGGALKEYLNDNIFFRREYGIYPVPAVHLNNEKEIPDDILKRADLYIHQDIRRDNSYGYKLSDEYTLPKLKDGCQRICIPNFVKMADAFYPTQVKERAVYRCALNAYFKDTLIEEAYINNASKTLENIMHYILEYRFTEDMVCAGLSAMAKKLKEREKNWDIKIVDYIIDNYKKQQMFVDVSHPSNDLMLKICHEVCKKLGIDDSGNKKIYQFNLGAEAFVWPQIRKILGIRWEKDWVREYTQNLYNPVGGY